MWLFCAMCTFLLASLLASPTSTQSLVYQVRKIFVVFFFLQSNVCFCLLHSVTKQYVGQDNAVSVFELWQGCWVTGLHFLLGQSSVSGETGWLQAGTLLWCLVPGPKVLHSDWLRGVLFLAWCSVAADATGLQKRGKKGCFNQDYWTALRCCK